MVKILRFSVPKRVQFAVTPEIQLSIGRSLFEGYESGMRFTCILGYFCAPQYITTDPLRIDWLKNNLIREIRYYLGKVISYCVMMPMRNNDASSEPLKAFRADDRRSR